MKSTVSRQTTTTEVKTWEITAEDIRRALDLPADAELEFVVPGGGNWSNMALSLDEHPICATTRVVKTEAS